MLIDEWDLPRALAVARIGLGAATVLNAREVHVTLSQAIDTDLYLPFFASLPSPNTAGLWVATCLGVATGLALILGWYARPAAVLATVVSGWAFLWDQQTYSSHRILALTLVLMLSFTACDRMWSLRPRPMTRSTPWVPLLMMSQLSVCYLFAGLSKVNGIFLSGRPFDVWLWMELPDVLAMSIAWGTVLAEVFMALALWFRRTRLLAILLGSILHISIIALMNHDNVVLVAFALTCMSIYPLFFVDRSALVSTLPEESVQPLPLRPQT